MCIFTLDPCINNKVRLNDNVVEVCYNAQWGLVCNDYFSYSTPAAEVVCRQVEIPSRSQFVVLLIKIGGQYVIILRRSLGLEARYKPLQ